MRHNAALHQLFQERHQVRKNVHTVCIFFINKCTHFFELYSTTQSTIAEVCHCRSYWICSWNNNT